MTPSLDKKDKMRRACSDILIQKPHTIREVAGLVGLMESYSVASEYGGNHLKYLELDRNLALKKAKGNFDDTMFLSSRAIDDIQWWLSYTPVLYKNIAFKHWHLILTTDASMEGWGAVLNDTAANGRWSDSESNLHINVLELTAVFFGLKSLIKETGKNVKIFSDNGTTVSYVNKKGGVKSPQCLAVANSIWNWAESRDIYLFAAHIPGVHNQLADMYSRKFKDNTEWELADKLFHKITDKWGQPSIDLFASRLNAKTFCILET